MASVAVLIWIGGGGAAPADDKLTEANMTQRDYDRITNTTNSSDTPETDPKVEVTPVHDLSRSEQKDLKDQGHATRVIKGKDWERETPEDRDAHLRRIRETAPPGSKFLIEVPNGDVWLLPPQDEETGTYLERFVYRKWAPHHREALPVSVLPGTGQSRSDISGTKAAPAVAAEEP